MRPIRIVTLAMALTVGGSPPPPVHAQDGVAGRVVEVVGGRAVAGAQVVLVATGLGTVSDAEGRFSFAAVPAGEHTLQVSHLGYRTEERRVRGGGGPVIVGLAEIAIDLDEIVVTGTPGGSSRRALSNSVGIVDAEEQMELAPVRDVGSLLAARTPGLQILQGSGQAGSGPRVTVRGISSLALAPEPVIYLDGVRVDNAPGNRRYTEGSGRLSDIDPDDIERIEVIRGPAAATLYGSEATAGVIQIFTKQGRAGGDTDVSVSVRQGASWFRDLEGRFPTSYWRDPATGEVVSMNLAALEAERGLPLFRTGHTQGYHLAVRGGGDAIRYYLSADYDDEEGIDRDNQARRFSGRVNLSADPLAGVELQGNFGFGFTWNEPGYTGHLANALRGNPRDLDTPLRGFAGAPQEATAAFENFRYDADRYSAAIKVRNTIGDWFTHQLTGGVDVNAEQGGFIQPKTDEYLGQFFTGFAADGAKAHQRRNFTSTTLEYGATAEVGVSDLRLTTSAGLQYFRTNENYLDVYGLVFPVPGISAVTGGGLQLVRDDRDITNTTVGVYVQEQIGWRDRVFVTGALRADDNSAFGADFDLAIYPKVGLSWVVEDGASDRISAIGTLKLRAAYGESGRQPEAFAAVRTFRPAPTPGGASVLTPDFAGNPDLGPERGRELEVGLDAALLDDRIGLELTFYDQGVDDAIVLRDAPPSLGFPGRQFVNGGSIRNRGLELSLSADAVRRADVALGFQLNLAHNDNEVESLGLLDAEYIQLGSRPPTRHQPGYPAQSIWGLRVVSARLDAAGRAVDVLCDGGPGAAPVACANAPLVFLGESLPTLRGGFSSTLTLFERVRLYALLDYASGGHKLEDSFSGSRCTSTRICEENVYPERFDPRRIAEVQLAGNAISTSVLPTDFVKLREVSAQLELPERWLRGLAERASLTLSGRNLYTWTRADDPPPGFDPESFITSGYTSGLIDSARLPLPAQFLTTLSISF